MATVSRAFPRPPSADVAGPAIRAEALGKRFGHHWAVRDLDLSVEAGEVFGFLGPNGAGKSTTIRMLLGLTRPTTGFAWLAGHPVDDVARAHAGRVRAGGGRVWPHLTGREVLELTAHLGPPPDLALPSPAGAAVRARPRQAGADLLDGNPAESRAGRGFRVPGPVLILDEPTSGLDPLMEQVFRA